MAGFLIFLALAIGLMWLLVVLPQRRRQAAHNTMIARLRPGDEVLTIGGLYGDVTEIGEDEVAVEIAPGVEVRVASRAITAVIPPDTYEQDEVAEEAEPPVRDSGPVEGVRGNREVPPTTAGMTAEPDEPAEPERR